MIEVSAQYKEKIINELMYNTLEINFPDGDYQKITEENISSESMTLKQSVCDENELKFGGCIASEFNIDLINTSSRSFDSSLVGKWISVKLTQTFPSGDKVYPASTLYPGSALYPGETIATQDFYIFSGFIDSAELDKNDKNKRHIVAYDAFAKLYETDATAMLFNKWKTFKADGGQHLRDMLIVSLYYNNVVTIPIVTETHGENKVDISMSPLNQTFSSGSAGVTVRDYRIINENWLNSNETISYGEAIKQICELLGVFGYIKPDSTGRGHFWMKLLHRDTDLGIDEKYQPKTENYDFYEDMFAEEYTHTGFTSIMCTVAGNDQGDSNVAEFHSEHILKSAPNKPYDMSDNIMAWSNAAGAAGTLSENHKHKNLLSQIVVDRMYQSEYTPLTATLDGRLWLEVCDSVAIKEYVTDADGAYVYDENGEPQTKEVNSIVLSRTISGIQALTDNIEAKGGK